MDGIIAIISDCLANDFGLGQSEALRTAVWDCPADMTPAMWVAACATFGINAGTTRNRRREALINLAICNG